ncbi:MAG: hypothetical protein LBP39_00530 [Rickettsiales bacterium]|jgi:hypothetical protein|nr:hypothetical protein [Rickettsiales bacterium]
MYLKKVLKKNKNVKFSPEDKNLKMSNIEGNKQKPSIIDTSATVDVSKLKFSEHVAAMTKEDIEKIEEQINSWWWAADNKDVDIPPDDTLSIGNRSINYETFKKLVDDKILSETPGFEGAFKFNFNKHSINAIANSLVKADKSEKYDIGLYEFKDRESPDTNSEKAKKELWLSISDMIDNQKNNRDNTMHIIVNRKTYPIHVALVNQIDAADAEVINAEELTHIGFSIVCGGRCFIFETSGENRFPEYNEALLENEDISNKLEGSLFKTTTEIQKTAYDCNSITLGTIKNFVKSFTKDFGSDPELFSEYLSLFFTENNLKYPSFLSEETIKTKKTEKKSGYTGILPKEFFKYAQTVRGMNKVKEVITEKLKETGMDGKKRKALEKLREKIDSINNKYVKAGVIKDSSGVSSQIKQQNKRAEFEAIKLLFDLGELENKGKLNRSALPTPEELASKTPNEKIKPEKTQSSRDLPVSKIFENIIKDAKLAQDNSNLSGGRKTFREREKEKKRKKEGLAIK